LAEPDDVALPAVFLALDDSRWISDELILVAGREWIILRSVIVHGCAGFGRQVINWQLQANALIEGALTIWIEVLRNRVIANFNALARST
jgi:hypothetical protein